MRGGNALPAAIFASAVVIALGIYFGLRAQGSSAALTATATPGSTVDAYADPPPRVVGAVDPIAAVTASVAAAEDPSANEARAVLERARTKLVETCWKPAAKKKSEPKSAQFTFMLAFDKAGRERARAISEVGSGDAARTEVADCLRGLDLPVSIPPTNAPVTVEVTLTLP